MGDAPSRYSATAGRGSYLALVALANLRREAGTPPRRPRCWAAASTSTRSTSAPSARTPSRCSRPAPSREAMLAASRRASTQLDPSARFLVGTALYEAAHAAAAEEQFRAVVAAPAAERRRPRRARRGAAVPAPGAEAAEAAAGVADGRAVRRRRPPHRAVRPDRRGRRGRRRDRRARAAADLAPAELAGYDAWRRLAAGEPPLPVPADGVPALAVAFEALLRVAGVRRRRARPRGDRALGAPGPQPPRAARERLPAPRLPRVGRSRSG